MSETPESETFDPAESQGTSGIRDAVIFTRIKSILSDYGGAIDLLAEPIQNGMDALSVAEEKYSFLDSETANLEIEIDAAENYITVTDNGRGFPREEVKELIAPEATTKQEYFEQGSVRGHKGVGLTYQAYGFDKLIIESIPRREDSDPYRLEFEGGRSWAQNSNYDNILERPEATIFYPDPDELNVDEFGTYVLMEASEHSSPSNFKRTLNNAQKSIAMIESQTALGVLTPHFDDHFEVDATLYYKNKQEEEFEEHSLRDEFRYPHMDINRDTSEDGVPEYEVVDSDNEVLWNDDNELKNSHKRTYHGVYTYYEPDDVTDIIPDDAEGTELESGQEIRSFIEEHSLNIYTLFTYSTRYQERIEEQWSIVGTTTFHKPGKRVGSDGMISGYHEPVNIKFGKFENRVWMVYSFSSVSPDTGRDDFSPKVEDVLRSTENRIFRDIRSNYEALLMSETKKRGGDPPEELAFGRDDLSVTEFESYGSIRLINQPAEENDVIALYNQMVGMGILKCFSPYFFSSSNDYDTYIAYDPEVIPTELDQALPGQDEVGSLDANMVAEFKVDGGSVLGHVNKRDREWTDLDLLVCWELSQREYQEGGRILRFSDDIDKNQRKYAGITHIATIDDRAVALPTICLEELMQIMDEKLN